MNLEKEKRSQKLINTIKLKIRSPYILIILVLIIILALCGIRIFQLNKDVYSYKTSLITCRKQVGRMKEKCRFCNFPKSSNKNKPENNKSTVGCTKIVNSYLDIHPIPKCNVTDLTLKQFEIDDTNIDIRAVFELVNDNYYSLTLYLGEKEIDNLFKIDNYQRTCEPEGCDGGGYIIADYGEINFVKFKEDSKTKLLGVVYKDPGPNGYYYYLEVFNKEGNIVFSAGESHDVHGVHPDINSGEINDSFEFQTVFVTSPPACTPEEYNFPDGNKDIESYFTSPYQEKKTYEIQADKIVLVDTKLYTYNDYCKR